MKLLPALVAVFPLAAHASVITFEAPNYTAGTNLGVTNGSTTNAPFDGVNGWSRSTSSGAGRIITTASSGEYVGSQALQGLAGFTYIGGTKAAGVIDYTGVNTISFDAQSISGIGIGFLGDAGTLGGFDQVADTGIAFGIGGSPGRFEYRPAGFGTEVFSSGLPAPTTGEWYHVVVTIGASVSGNRLINMVARDLTTSTDMDLNGASTAGNVWSFSVTDAQFGVAPEAALGVFVRVTTAASGTGGTIDNLNFTAVPEPATAVLGGLGLLGLLRRRRK